MGTRQGGRSRPGRAGRIIPMTRCVRRSSRRSAGGSASAAARPSRCARPSRHRDAITQFLAAEGLAKAGRGDGLNVLLASIDFATEPGYPPARGPRPRRAGRRAGARRAAEARRRGRPRPPGAGPRGHRPHGPFLEGRRGLQAPGTVRQGRHQRSASRALDGLRWLDTRAAWQIIRQWAADRASSIRIECRRAAGLQRRPGDPRPAAPDAGRRRAEGDPRGALTAARRIFGRDSLEPDYAVLQNKWVSRLRRLPGDPRPGPRPRRAAPHLRDPAEVCRRSGARRTGHRPPEPARAARRRGARRPRESRPDHGRGGGARPGPGRREGGRRRAGGGEGPGEVAEGLGREAPVVRPQHQGRRRRGEPGRRRSHRLRAGPGLGGGPAGRRHRGPRRGRLRAAG